jgi:DNA replication protein DnaC
VTAAEFLSKLENVDLLIIDEASGDKTTNSESTRECMFRLLEDVYNGNCRAAVILLGNFFRGSIGEVFGNEDAARRRLADTFLAVRIDRRTETVTQIKLI